jgi:hypothetical protein
VIRRGGLYREQENVKLKTVLDTFFVAFYSTKNTRTDVFNNYTQRVNYNIPETLKKRINFNNIRLSIIPQKSYLKININAI